MAVAQETTSSLDSEMSFRTVCLEKEYERVLSESARLLDVERDRMRRMEHLLLKFESDALRAQLDQANAQALRLATAESEASLQLDEACREIDRLDLHAQTSSGEIERLKGVISSLNSNSASYNSAVAEKVHLSRDLSSLRSEVERLKTQNASYQALVAEKREMERQLNSLEVQLENEKHAHERTRVKGSQQAEEFAKLSARFEELRNELAGEARVKQHQGWDTQRAMLEGKIETLKKQLRSTKDKLQEAQNDLQHRHGNARVSEGDIPDSRTRTVPLQRPGSDYSAGMTIATPGAVRVQEKIKRQSALPGDKSAFSITPYLNRTGARSESPRSSMADEDDIPTTAAESHPSLGDDSVLAEPRNFDDDSSQIKPPSTQARSTKKSNKAASTREPKKLVSRPEPEDFDGLHDQPADAGQAKPKRRKLGGQRDRNLFDEEGEEELLDTRKPGRKLTLGAGLNSVLGGLQAPSAAPGMSRALGFGASGGFSPLKRDRKRL